MLKTIISFAKLPMENILQRKVIEVSLLDQLSLSLFIEYGRLGLLRNLSFSRGWSLIRRFGQLIGCKEGVWIILRGDHYMIRVRKP
jgi:hypothetical protein